MTFQRKLLLGVSLMVIPALLVGVEAIRSNALEQHSLEALGESLGRSRTYSELETKMFDQSEVIWRHLSGLDPTAEKEFRLTGEVVDYWFDRWSVELEPDEAPLAAEVRELQRQFVAVGDSIFRLTGQGRRPEAFRLAVTELRYRLQPALTALNRQIYRRTRESSVQAAFTRVEQILAAERRFLVGIVLATLVLGVISAWALAKSLVGPINRLRGAMATVGSGDLEHPIDTTAQDEIGDLARSFDGMTGRLRESRAELLRLNNELAGKVAELERAQAQLVQSEKLASIGEMAAAVAHGLRNPLASLRASAQLVLRHPGTPAAGEQLRAIIEEVDRLDRRITHLLTFSRPAPFHPLPERIEPLIQGILPAFTERMRSQGVALSLELQPGLPEFVADPMRLEQALVELVSNALDAMPGGGRLTLAAAPADGAGEPGLALEIRDTGWGIAPDVLREVGQPFFTTRPEGTGLGLATARRFIEQHGGRLDLTSRQGEGTTVRIWLPLRPPVASAAPATSAASAPSSP
jgi:signal transduction histidine kinase